MSKTAGEEVVDGRRMRSERSRKAIIDASLSLLEDGILVPTAQQVAERAGVGIRSFFRHFEDMESLFRAIDEQVRDQYEALFRGGDRDGTLAERIQHAVERHAHAYRVGYYEMKRDGSKDPNLAGLDATVYFPLVDFKFTNDTKYWLLMETYMGQYDSLTWKF